MLAAGEASARRIGVAVNIAVLDAGAHLKAFARMDGAVLGSIDLAMKKARTAVLFETTSEAVWDYCKPGAPAHALELSNGGLAPFAGGISAQGPERRQRSAPSASRAALSHRISKLPRPPLRLLEHLTDHGD